MIRDAGLWDQVCEVVSFPVLSFIQSSSNLSAEAVAYFALQCLVRVQLEYALDLKDAFSDMRGWSSSNLKYMRFFAQHCPDGLFGQQPADQLPWFPCSPLKLPLCKS